MRGSTIVLSGPDAKGKFEEGVITDTSKPGTLMQIDASVQTLKHGRLSWKAAAPGTDGLQGCYAVLREDVLQGFDATKAYVAGTPCFLYFPVAGDDLNLRLGEVAGTGNTYAIGDKLITDAEDGILVPNTGSPQEVRAVCCEVVTQVAGSTLAWCKWAN